MMASALKVDSNHRGLTEPRLAPAFSTIRREHRTNEVRSAEYTPFPRVSSDQNPRLGFTRDMSALGMCLGVDRPEPVGSLLRVEVRRIDGASMGATVGRVVWCSSAHAGRFWLGLDLMCEINAPRIGVRSSASES
jgi:hypothetical protein